MQVIIHFDSRAIKMKIQVRNLGVFNRLRFELQQLHQGKNLST